MQATPRTLLGIFEQTLRYVVPIFQRHYVWGVEEQWQPLWEDVLEKHAARGSFPSDKPVAQVPFDFPKLARTILRKNGWRRRKKLGSSKLLMPQRFAGR
jgi:hypothetical protein